MVRTPSRIAHFILVACALGLATVAAAALKDKPPKGVSLGGTGWRLDPTRSDDPDVVIDQAHKDMRAQENARRENTEREVFDDDGPLGRGYGNDSTWGGGFPTGSRRRDDLPPYDRPIGRDRGGWGNDRGRTSTDIDPAGGRQSGSITFGSGGGRSEFLGQLTRNPDTLSFREANEHLTVAEDRLETDCAPGAKNPISDSYGDGEQRCGWDGRAWVIETKRGKHFMRVDRFEVSKDGKSLNYVTTASGNRIPKIRIERRYTLAPPAPASG